jgi:hypothetical protein
MDAPKTRSFSTAMAEDNTSSHEEALLRIYQRLRPGNPPQLEKAELCSMRSSTTPIVIALGASVASV